MMEGFGAGLSRRAAAGLTSVFLLLGASSAGCGDSAGDDDSPADGGSPEAGSAGQAGLGGSAGRGGGAGMAGSAGTAAGAGSAGTAGAGASAGGANAGGSGGSAGSAGGAGAGGAGAGGAGSGGAGGTVGCGTELAPPRTYTKTVVSERVVDYELDGAPGAQDHRVLLLLFNASSRNASTPDEDGIRMFYTPEQLGDTYFLNPDGVAAFLSEASYGKVSLSGRVVGWFEQEDGAMPTAAEFQSNVLAYVEQAAGDATFNDYDVIYVVGLTDGDDSLQVGWQLENSLMTSQGLWVGGIDWMVNSSFYTEAGGNYYYSVILPSRTWAHELHHTLGLFGHDISMDCGNVTLAEACAFNGYGNGFSLMGESFLGNHPSIGMKSAVGWLDAGQLVTVNQTQEVTLCSTATVDERPKGLVIPLKTPLVVTSTTVNEPATFDRIYVEFRTAAGFDRYLDRLTDPDWINPFINEPRTFRKDGVVITLGYANADTQSSILLDMHPDSDFNPNNGIYLAGNVGKFLDSMLYVGETFELAEQGIRISPLALAGGGITVRVEY